MTEEELREKIAREIGNAVFACQNDPGWRTTESADQILALIREAGWRSPEDWKEKWDASEHYK